MSCVTNWHTRTQSRKHTLPASRKHTLALFCEQTRGVHRFLDADLRCCSQSLCTSNTHAHTHARAEVYLQPFLCLITLYIELIMFYRSVNNRMCPEEAGDTPLPFRTIFQSSKPLPLLSAQIVGFLSMVSVPRLLDISLFITVLCQVYLN